MNCVLRKWRLSDAKDLAAALSNKKILNNLRQDYAKQEFTVNSSPFAVEVYRHLGFVPTGTEQIVDGIRFTPMEMKKLL